MQNVSKSLDHNENTKDMQKHKHKGVASDRSNTVATNSMLTIVQSV